MDRCRARFATEHNLDKSTIVKTWGLKTLDGYIAACITVHPTEMVEYLIPSAERSIVVFSHVDLEDIITPRIAKELRPNFPWELSLESHPSPGVRGKTVDTILNSGLSPREHISNLDCRMLCLSARASASIWDDNRTNRLERAIVVLQSTERLKNVKLGQEIAFLTSLQQSDDSRPPEILVTRNKEAQESLLAMSLVEICEIPGCGEPLIWIDLTTTRCKRGHGWRESISLALTTYSG